MSCPHFDVIMKNNQIKSTFLNKYRMVKNLLQQSVDLNNNCDFMAHICNDCGEVHKGGNTFLCMHCTYIGCWGEKHFQQHLKQSKHNFGVNANTGELFCFRCENYLMQYDILSNIDQWSNWDLIEAASIALPNQFHTLNGLIGIHNMGSTCFMSSVIQCLIHNPYFAKWMFDQNHVLSCDLQNETACLSCAMQDIMNAAFSPNYDSDKPFVKLLQYCFKINTNFTGYTQQDAHEFWQFLLNQVHSDYKRCSKNVDLLSSDTSAQQQSSPLSGNLEDNEQCAHHLCNCISHTTFQGFLKSIITCPSCAKDSTTVDPFMDLSLEILNTNNKNEKQPLSTLYDCLDKFHKIEILQDYAFNCSHCSKKNIKSVSKKFVINKLPPVLTFQLKRFSHNLNGASEKLNHFVEFPRYLNMKNYLDFAKSSESFDLIYELFAVISHDGTVDSGHYVSFCKVTSDVWIKFNDADVQQVPEEDVLKEKAYLLFYIVRSK